MAAVTKARGLGKWFDIGVTVANQDMDASGITGKNIYMGDCEGILFLVTKGIGTTDDFALDLQEVNGVAGTPRDLDIITEYFTKTAASTTLAGTEIWVKTTQAAASEIAAITGTAAKQLLLAFEVRADQLSDGYTHLAVNVPDLGSGGAQFGSIVGIKWGLAIQRAPANMPASTR